METSRVLDRTRGRSRGRTGEASGSLELAAAYDSYAGPLYRYLLTLLQHTEAAEDAVQEVFLGLLRRRGRRPIENLRAYLFQAAHNQALMALRRRKKRGLESGGNLLSWVDLENRSPHDREAAIDVDRALRRLSAPQREIIALKLSEGFTFREVGAVLGVSGHTAASRYRVALARLRALLEGGDTYD